MNITKIDGFQFEIDGESIAATKKAKIVGDTIYLEDKFRCGGVIKIPFSELTIDGKVYADIGTATKILNSFVGAEGIGVTQPVIEDVSDTFYLEQNDYFELIKLSAKKMGHFIFLQAEVQVKDGVQNGMYPFLKSTLFTTTNLYVQPYSVPFHSVFKYGNDDFVSMYTYNYFFIPKYSEPGSFILVNQANPAGYNSKIVVDTVLTLNKYWFGEV